MSQDLILRHKPLSYGPLGLLGLKIGYENSRIIHSLTETRAAHQTWFPPNPAPRPVPNAFLGPLVHAISSIASPIIGFINTQFD